VKKVSFIQCFSSIAYGSNMNQAIKEENGLLVYIVSFSHKFTNLILKNAFRKL
jgi:hypothetical protein